MLKKLVAFMFLCVSLCFLMVGSVSANEKSLVTPEELTELKKYWDEVGFDEENQKLLENKLKNGELPDAMNIEKEPTDIKVKNENNKRTTIYYYPDGSYNFEVVESERPEIPESSLNNYLNNLYWTETVKRNHVNFSVSYKLDIAYITTFQGCRIERIYDQRMSSMTGTFSNIQFNIIRERSTPTTPAYAELRFHHNAFWGGTYTYVLGANVTNTGILYTSH